MATLPQISKVNEQEIQEALHRITVAAGSAAVDAGNPCGLVANYEAGHDRPWVLADDWHHERFVSPEVAEAAARQWTEQS